MAVLLLTGKPVNWADPPKANTKVMWSQRTTDGKRVYGSFRAIAWLDRINWLAKKRFGRGIIAYQGGYNTTIKKSKGTHDYSEAFDLWIPGVSGGTQQMFFRANGGGFFHRVPPAFMEHEHGFVLPPALDTDVSKRFMRARVKVGKFIDGGWALYGRVVGSSQIADYYGRKDALADHSHDSSWHPGDKPGHKGTKADIDATIFNLSEYIKTKQEMIRRAA